MEDQITLFDDELEEEYPAHIFLNVIKDLVAVEMSIKDIFNTNLYDSMQAVTFVASPKFFFHTTRGFKKIQLILGIEDGQVSSEFTTGLNSLLIENRINFWNQLSEETKEQIRSQQYQVRYTQNGYTVHSKFFLLKGVENTRLIVGSANFTENAMSGRKQFEELLIFDNHPLFETYEQRFKSILEYTNDYVPEKIKKPSTQPVFIADGELIKDILFDEITSKRIKFALSEEEMDEIKLLPEKVDVMSEQTQTAKQIVELITKKDKKNNLYTLLPSAQLKAKSMAIKTILTRTTKKSEQLDTRSELYYSEKNSQLYTKLKSELTDNKLQVFTAPILDSKVLKQNIESLVSFIEAYDIFTVREDKKNLSRIFEIILYSFMAAYIWKMRDDYHLQEGRKSVRRHFPPFLFIAGRPFSGKTTILEYIGLLLGNTPPYMSYENIKNSKVLLDYFRSSNLMPLLIDEIDLKFFTSTAEDKGERLVKYISNEREGQHPCLIGTTNATGFDMNHQAAMRIYYLQIDNTFDKKKSSESSKYLNDILSHVNTSLYQDFTYRMAKLLEDGQPFYKPNDFLFAAREIFKKYFWELEMDLPDWFPQGIFNDFDHRGQLIWREHFRTNREYFDVRRDNSIFIRIDEIAQNPKDKRNITNFLPPECIQEDSSILVVNKEIFFNFIGVHSKTGQSLLKKMTEYLIRKDK